MGTRVLLPVVVAVALAPGGAAVAEARGPASVHVSDCRTGSDPSHRSATYKAWMHAVPGSTRMSMRFRLIAHYAGHRPQQLPNSKLGVLHRSRKGVTRYGYTQTVTQLRAGGSYRMLVRYRWYDASGHVIKHVRRVSGACVESGKLPNLTVTAVNISPGPTPKRSVYSVSIANTGQGPGEDFSVTLILDGAVADSRTIERLGAGRSVTIDMNGPPCRRLRAVVDRENVVPETNEDDNSLRSRC